MSRETLESEGYVLIRAGMAAACVAQIAASVDKLDVRNAGTRNLLSLAWCREVAASLRAGLSKDGFLSADSAAVQCTLFSKPSFSNWKVALHQDLSVPVEAKVEHPGLSGWSCKEGATFVQPPIQMLQQMLAVRLHLDRCSADDGPLRVVPRSHRHGRLDADAVRSLDRIFGRVECSAETGDLLLMRPLLLHSSSKAPRPVSARRVMHFLFGPRQPGFGLQWSVPV